MTRETETLLTEVLRELLAELRARRRDRERDEHERRLDEALTPRGYTPPRQVRR